MTVLRALAAPIDGSWRSDRRNVLLGAGAALLACGAAAGPLPNSAAALTDIERRSGGRLGVAVIRGGRLLAGLHAHERFPLCSTFKLLLVGAVLARVDAGQERLDRLLPVARADAQDYAPVVNPRVGGVLSIGALCAGAMRVSDNAAANLLLGTIGGPPALTRFLRQQGSSITRLDRDEPTLNDVAPGDRRDTTTPADFARLAARLVLGPVLSPSSRATLRGWLETSTTGANRLRAGLPALWGVGDRTGTGPAGETNDVAVAWPPRGAPLVIACYLVAPQATPQAREAVHVAVARALGAGFS